MKKTRIAFEDIQAGDLIEAVDKVHGLKMTYTGIAFEMVEVGGTKEWRTAQGGIIVVNDLDEPETIWRIDARVSTFDDIQKGDVVQVTTTIDDAEFVVTGKAHSLREADGDWYDSWNTEQGQTLVYRNFRNPKIEILEREGE